MPDKLYQECRTVLRGCRAILEDLRATGVERLPEVNPAAFVPSSVTDSSPEVQPPQAKSVDSSQPELLEDIQRELSNCQGCALCSVRKRVVFGAGHPKARLVIVGDAPTSQEEDQGTPFVGEAGQLLDRILFAMKLSRDQVYICNVIKCHPGVPSSSEEQTSISCDSILRRQLAAISPEIIISLGDFATQTLLQSCEPVNQLRGRWHDYAGIPLMPTFHPDYLLSHPVGKHQVWEDVKLVMHRLQELD